MRHSTQASPERIMQYAVNLVLNGSAQDFHSLARQRELMALRSEHADTYVAMDFDYSQRNVLYTYVNNRIIGRKPIDYLEFGVAKGGSMKEWLRINTCPESRFYGFDSFEGLPEFWREGAPEGTFSTGGRLPDIDDDRVTFIKGLFQQTVDAFSRDFKPRNRLVVHIDADLYSSTLYVLMNLDRHMVPGTVILFDELSARNYTDEFAALQDWSRACLKGYDPLVGRPNFAKLAVLVR